MFYLKQNNKTITLTFTFWLTEYYISEPHFGGILVGYFFVFKDFIIRYNVFESYNKIIISKVLIVEMLYKPPQSCSARQRLQLFFVKMGTFLYTCNVFYFRTFTPYCSFSHI